ncbi:MAG: ABC transporter permease subunit [Ignavibacteriales bacterium]|nr:ABC transporter permease subunit [Ignavibacteriales bacterium]
MLNIKHIFFRELRSLFDSPVAYIVSVVFLGLLGWFFTSSLFLANVASLRTVFEMTPFFLLFFGPAMTMRLLSEEKKGGTLELLVTKPIMEYEIVVGKFLAAWMLFFATLLPTLVYFLTISFLGKIDMGPIIGGYIGLMLVGGVFLSLGVLGSSITENQIIAFIVSFLIVFVLFILDKILVYFPGDIATILEYLGVDYHFSNIARGVIDTRDLVYYFSMMGLALLVGTVMLEKRKW